MQVILKTVLSSLILIGLNGTSSAYDTQHSQKDARNVVDFPVGMVKALGNFDSCQEQFANNKQPVIKDIQGRKARALCFTGFAVMHSGNTKTPIYVAEVLNRTRIQNAKGEERTNKFFPDARLPNSERANLIDYSGSGFDRGHNSPAGDAESPEGMAQSFSLANMMPQAPENNRGAWAKIEKSTRKYAERARGNVYVVTGSILLPGQCPSFDPKAFKVDENCKIHNTVTVPSHIYKLVYDISTNRAWAHWISNTNEARISPPISYDELVKRTGIEFLPGIVPNV